MKRNKYITKNLHLAAFLYTSELQFFVDRKENGEVYFHFSAKNKAEKLIADYFAGVAVVNPREFVARLNDLKDIIFNRPKDE